MRGEFIDVGGARLYYWATGTRGGGEPIVLLHGFPTSSHLWARMAGCLPEGHRVLVVDLLGFGRSDRPRGRPLGVRAHAERVIELLEQETGHKALLDPKPMQIGDVPETFADISAIERDHGFAPKTSIDEGVPRFVAWYRDYHGLK